MATRAGRACSCYGRIKQVYVIFFCSARHSCFQTSIWSLTALRLSILPTQRRRASSSSGTKKLDSIDRIDSKSACGEMKWPGEKGRRISPMSGMHELDKRTHVSEPR